MPRPMPLIRSATLTAGIVLAICAAAGPAWGQSPEPESVLAPGDVVRITVWRQPELSGEYRIMADGAIGHPLYQAVNVRGMSLPALTTRLRQFLTTYEQNPQVVVEPLLRVGVGGEVRVPSLYSMPVGTTIAQAIAQAGGASESGNVRKVRLVRDGREQMLDLTSPRASDAGTLVQSGDQIFMGRRGNFFRDFIGPFASVLAAGAAIIGATR